MTLGRQPHNEIELCAMLGVPSELFALAVSVLKQRDGIIEEGYSGRSDVRTLAVPNRVLSSKFMLRMVAYPAPPLVIIVGGGELGSGIAVRLHCAGCAVVICDEADPSWPRRGMAFTNAWYLGNAEVAGEAAVFCASVKSIPAVLNRHRLIAATTWSWAGAAAMLHPIVIVDATVGTRGAALELKSRVPDDIFTIAVGPISARDYHVDAVVRMAPIRSTATQARSTVVAERSGRFITNRRIGDRVVEAEVVGAIGSLLVQAPQNGVLRGLSARGARVREGAEVVEVDSRGDPVNCFGLCPEAASLGDEIVALLASRRFIDRELKLD